MAKYKKIDAPQLHPKRTPLLSFEIPLLLRKIPLLCPCFFPARNRRICSFLGAQTTEITL
jgi:hypothetical protein